MAAPMTIQKARDVVADRVNLSEAMLRHFGLQPQIVERIALNALAREPALLECDPKSLDVALMTCMQLGLLPDGYEAVILPFRDKKAGIVRATVIAMIGGRLKLARAATPGIVIRAMAVFAGDHFVHREGEDARLEHSPNPEGDRSADALLAVYASALTPQAPKPEWVVLYRGDIERARARSRSADRGPWKTDYVEMAKKTALGQVLKRLPRRPGIDDAGYDYGLDAASDDAPPPPATIDVDVVPGEGAAPAEGDHRLDTEPVATAGLDTEPVATAGLDTEPVATAGLNDNPDPAPAESAQVESAEGDPF